MNIYFYLIIVQIILLSVQGILYLTVQKRHSTYNDMECVLDKKLPLIPQSIFIYILWFPLIAIYPLYLYFCNPVSYYTYILAILMDIVISCIIYLNYPTSFTRPTFKTDTISKKLLSILYKLNYKGLNCMPSMHCSMCFIILLSTVGCSTMPLCATILLCAISCGIICSTVLTKQHVIIDVITAFPLSLFCWILSLLIL